MKKLFWPVVLLACVGLGACASPERKACNRMAELCGMEEKVENCEQALAEVKKVAPDELPNLVTCMQESSSCSALLGCQAGAALKVGLGAGKGFLEGLRRSLSGGDQKK